VGATASLSMTPLLLPPLRGLVFCYFDWSLMVTLWNCCSGIGYCCCFL